MTRANCIYGAGRALLFALMTSWLTPVFADSAGTETPHAKIGQFGLDLTAYNPKVRAADDFDEYANGGWRATVTLPADDADTGT